MVVVNLYGLDLDETTILVLGIERLKVNDIGFDLSIFDMVGWHERLWVGIYKGVEVQEVKIVNWNVKSFVCMCEGWKVLKYWTKWCKEYLFFN